MRKILISAISLAAIIISGMNLTNKQNISSPDPNLPFQFQIVIKNLTNNVIGGTSNNFGTWFYLDMTINSITYNNDNYKNIVIENGSNSGESTFIIGGRIGDKDIFITPCGTETTILSMTMQQYTYFQMGFTFGTFYYDFGYQHAQLTFANNYLYHMYDEYANTGNNGTKLIINANGEAGANSANWEFQYYKF